MCSPLPENISSTVHEIPNCFNVPKRRWGWTWKAFDRSRYQFYNENSQTFKRTIKAIHYDAIDAFLAAPDSTQGITAAQTHIEQQGIDQLESAYKRVYENTASAFAKGVSNHIKDVGLAELALLSVRDFLTVNLLGRVSKVAQTNQRNIGKFLNGAMREVLDLGPDQVIPNITSVGQLNQIALLVRQRIRNRYAKTKADVMSVTETATASNLGLLVAAQSLNMTLDKGWLSQRDNRVRLTHTGADGQTVKLGRPFNVGGYQMQFPGDWSLGAPADELINCRCVLIFFNRN